MISSSMGAAPTCRCPELDSRCFSSMAHSSAHEALGAYRRVHIWRAPAPDSGSTVSFSISPGIILVVADLFPLLLLLSTDVIFPIRVIVFLTRAIQTAAAAGDVTVIINAETVTVSVNFTTDERAVAIVIIIVGITIFIIIIMILFVIVTSDTELLASIIPRIATNIVSPSHARPPVVGSRSED